jgi:hypothetical protein
MAHYGVCASFWEDEIGYRFRNTFINGDGILFNISPPKLLIHTIQIETFTSGKLLLTLLLSPPFTLFSRTHGAFYADQLSGTTSSLASQPFARGWDQNGLGALSAVPPLL